MSKRAVITNVRKIVVSLKPKAIVYTDGSCLYQGKPNAQAGYGNYWDDNHPSNQFGRVPGYQDINRSEIYAVYQATRKANELGYPRIIVYTDSNYVLYVFKNLDDYKNRSITLNRDLLQWLREETQRIDVEIKKVKGHSGVHGNVQADKIARAGAKIKQNTV